MAEGETRRQEQSGEVKPPFRLVPDRVSRGTVRALEQLLADARRGELIGIGFVGMYRQREYVANVAGEAKRNPTFTRGMLRALDDELGRLVNNGNKG